MHSPHTRTHLEGRGVGIVEGHLLRRGHGLSQPHRHARRHLHQPRRRRGGEGPWRHGVEREGPGRRHARREGPRRTQPCCCCCCSLEAAALISSCHQLWMGGQGGRAAAAAAALRRQLASRLAKRRRAGRIRCRWLLLLVALHQRRCLWRACRGSARAGRRCMLSHRCRWLRRRRLQGGDGGRWGWCRRECSSSHRGCCPLLRGCQRLHLHCPAGPAGLGCSGITDAAAGWLAGHCRRRCGGLCWACCCLCRDWCCSCRCILAAAAASCICRCCCCQAVGPHRACRQRCEPPVQSRELLGGGGGGSAGRSLRRKDRAPGWPPGWLPDLLRGRCYCRCRCSQAIGSRKAGC